MDIINKIKNLLRPLYYSTVIKWHKNAKCRKTRNLFLTYKNKHLGEKCFIVANGPSLRMDDLDKIQRSGITTFGVNRICRIYDKTIWRPKYFCVQDETIIFNSIKEIDELTRDSVLFMRSVGYSKYDVDRAIYFNSEISYCKNMITPPFLEGENCLFADGLTVIYSILQLASYMGFKEIYLIGCDCSYRNNDNVTVSDYVDDRLAQGGLGMPPAVDYWFRAYRVADEYTKLHGKRIFNVTRGGMLDVFERVDLDKILQ